MANKRQLKKRISNLCGALAADVMLASHFDGVDRAKAEELVAKVASLQETARANVSFAFDRVAKDFESRADYNRARAKYNAAAFAKLKENFAGQLTELLKEVNAAVPAQVRECVQKL